MTASRRGSRLYRGLGVLVATAAALYAGAPARANHSIIEHVSTGPDASGAGGAARALASSDGSRVIFESGDRLVGADADDNRDVYERSGGTTRLISTGPSGGGDADNVDLIAVSEDGSRVFFTTAERLTGADEDDQLDIYERVGATTSLVSTGPDGGDGDFTVYTDEFGGASADGTKVVFRTEERLVAADTDSVSDVYLRSAGTTTLVSTGPTDDGNAEAGFSPYSCPGCWPATSTPLISRNGTHVFFYTQDRFVAADVDSAVDLYEWTGGVTRLVSTGPTDTGGIGPTVDVEFDTSDDGTRVIFATNERLVAEDLDNLRDVYERANGTTTTLVSTGPNDTHNFSACITDEFGEGCRHRISPDGSHIFFFTYQALAAPDNEAYLDLYDRSGGTVQLVSTGPAGGNGPFDVDGSAYRIALSDDGSHVFFATRDALTSDDLDGGQESIYERSGGTTSLHPTGNVSTFFDLRSSADGTRLFFWSLAKLVPADLDSKTDVYERYAGTTTLISTGPTDAHTYDARHNAISDDGRHVVFNTVENLVSTDNVPVSHDVYVKRVAAGASPSAVDGGASQLPGYKELFNPGGGDVLP